VCVCLFVFIFILFFWCVKLLAKFKNKISKFSRIYTWEKKNYCSECYPTRSDPSRRAEPAIPSRAQSELAGLSPARTGSTPSGPTWTDPVRGQEVARHKQQAENLVFSVLREHRGWHPRSINGASRVRQ